MSLCTVLSISIRSVDLAADTVAAHLPLCCQLLLAQLTAKKNLNCGLLCTHAHTHKQCHAGISKYDRKIEKMEN